VSGEAAQQIQSRILQRRMKLHQQIMGKHQSQLDTKLIEVETKKEEEGVEEEKSAISAPPAPPAPSKTNQNEVEKDVWHVVRKKSHGLSSPINDSRSFHSPLVVAELVNHTILTHSIPSNGKNLFSNLEDVGVLSKYECGLCRKNLKEDSFSRSQLHKGVERKCVSCLKLNQTSPKAPAPISTVPKPLSLIPGASPSMILLSTNGKLASKVLNKKLGSEKKTNTKDKPFPQTAKAAPPPTEVAPTKVEEESKIDGESSTSLLDLSDEPECLGEWKNLWRSSPETSEETNSKMGVFRTLNRDTSCILLSYLQVNDILSLGTCCRGTASLCDDWLVWRNLLRRTYPRSALTPIGPNSSWKTAFMLEANNLSQALTCFTSFSTKVDSVLGFPVSFTTNPKTGCLDYATSTFDILSLDSYLQGNVRKTVWGEQFTDFLPIYIDQDHFLRGLPQLIRASRKIVQTGLLNLPRHHSNNNNHKHNHSKGGMTPEIPEGGAWMPRTDPEFILTLLTKMMNTQVVLLCDKGISASEVALMGYCQLHRLLLAVVDHFPQLRMLIRKRLEDFAHQPETRVKALTPSLGELLALLSVSDSYSWHQLSLPYLKESFDRSVLWACSKDPSLAVVTPGDESRLVKYLATQRVSMRLTLFHAVFLNLLVQGGGSKSKLEDCADRYDTFEGRPPLYLRREWQRSVNAILEFETWPQYFSISGMPLPSKPFLLSTLEQAVKNSLKKGYHSRNTVFQNVMKSGVSRILLKGETYSAAPNLKQIRMVESWRYDGETIFLDASCLVYAFSGDCLETVDYSNTRAYTTSSTGHPVLYIEHSGDIIDYNAQKGEHSIHINVQLIPPTVAALFFTVSAWTTTLNEIYQPSAQLFDSESDTEMCRYKLEDQDTGDKTAVIMCKLHRASVGARWQLTSIGHVGHGRAGNYTSILRDVKRYL
jgi:stress response protein SCP2